MNDKIGVVASFGLPDGYPMNRNTIQITSSQDRAYETDSAALAKEAGKKKHQFLDLAQRTPAGLAVRFPL
ncbi:MAG: hypothetical protein ABSH38_13835 [Verrucomicrobiota bacterium]|jgi:hypothetical protein